MPKEETLYACPDCDSCHFSFAEYRGGLDALMCGLWMREIMNYNDYWDRVETGDETPITPPDWCKLPVRIERGN